MVFFFGCSYAHDYSSRKAEIGSIRIAFLAGSQLADSATASRTDVAVASVTGSVGPMPNKRLASSLRTAKHPAKPINVPNAARRNARPVIIRKIATGCAPNAIRIAIVARLLDTM